MVATPVDRHVALRGGEDLVSNAIEIKPGRLLYSLNVECPIQGGYRRITGHQRFNGTTSPEDAVYYTMPFSSGAQGEASTARDRRLSVAAMGLPWLVPILPLPEGEITKADRRLIVGLPARFRSATSPLTHGMTITGLTSGATAKLVLTKTLAFADGSKEFLIGERISGNKSKASGTALYVDKTSGEWSDGTAAGNVYLSAISGTFANMEVLSSASGYAAASGSQVDYALATGAWSDSDAAGTFILTQVVGTFQTGETVDIAGVLTATAGALTQGAEDTDPKHFSAQRHSIECLRADIPKLPGSGAIRGVWIYNDVVYAFRDNNAATQCLMYKATASGWSQITFPIEVPFDTGTEESAGVAGIEVGDTITDATSGATGVVSELILTSGTWAGGNAAGRLFVGGNTGTWGDNNNIQVAGVTRAKVNGTQSSTTLAPGGRYEFINYNFFGTAAKKRMYWCDGVNKAHQFDGVTAVPINTSMVTDKPTHILAHRRHLFLSFPGGSIQHSAIGNPYSFAPILGASEIATGDEVTGMFILPGEVMGVLDRNRTYLLHGKSAADWNFVTHSNETGGREWSAQVVGTARFLDDAGLTGLNVTDAFGGFEAATWSHDIQPVIEEKIKNTSVTCSCVVRTKNQYRIFFADGTALYATWNGGTMMGLTRVELGKVVRTICSEERSDGSEEIYFGSDDGYVYKESGNSLDGVAMESLMRLPYWHYGTPNHHKCFHKSLFDIEAPVGTRIVFIPDYDYGSPDASQEIDKVLNAEAGGGYWNVANWDEFFWSAPPIAQAEADLNGIARNVGFLFYSRSLYSGQWICHGMVTTFAEWGAQR